MRLRLCTTKHLALLIFINMSIVYLKKKNWGYQFITYQICNFKGMFVNCFIFLNKIIRKHILATRKQKSRCL